MPGECDVAAIAKQLDEGNGDVGVHLMYACWGRQVRANPKYNPLTRGSDNPADMTPDNQTKLLLDAAKEQTAWYKSVQQHLSPKGLCQLKFENFALPIPELKDAIRDIEAVGDKCRK